MSDADCNSAEPRWVVLFDSIHDVLAAEQVFKERAVWCDVAPVPRSLSADCGMAIEVRQRDQADVRVVLADPRVRPRRVLQAAADGYEEVHW